MAQEGVFPLACLGRWACFNSSVNFGVMGSTGNYWVIIMHLCLQPLFCEVGATCGFADDVIVVKHLRSHDFCQPLAKDG